MMKHTSTREVAFTQTTVFVYQPMHIVVDNDEFPIECPKVVDLIPKERLIHRMVARKAVVSIQQHLRENSEIYPRKEDRIRRMSEFASKFSQRAKDIALESARINSLEAYGGEAQYPKSIFDTIDLSAPVKLTEFPSFQIMPRRVSLEDPPTIKKTSKRKSCEL